jgi:hypothetical protein
MGGTENVELVQSSWRRLIDTGELPVEVLDPEVEWNTLLESYHGVDGVREWQRSIEANLGGMDIEMTEIDAIGEEKVCAEVEIKGQAQITGIEGAVHSSTVWTIRDGLVLRVDSYMTREEALRAAEE